MDLTYMTLVGEPTTRCGYRIQNVEDIPHGFEGVRVKGPDWYAIMTHEQWAPYAALPDDEFAVQVLALGLEMQLGIPIVARVADEWEDKPFDLYTAVRERLSEIDPRLVPHPAQVGMFEGYAAVGAALLAAVGAHTIIESVYDGGRREHFCDTCPDKPAYPCREHREVAEALGIEIPDA